MKSYPGLAHSINYDIINDFSTFLKTHLPHAPEHVPPPKEFNSMSVKELKVAVQEANLQSSARGFTEKSEFIELLQKHYDGPHKK